MEKRPVKLIRWPALRKLFDDNISRSTIDRWEKAGEFPVRIHLGKHLVAWNLNDIELWFLSKTKANG